MGQWLSGGGIYCSSVKVPCKPSPATGMRDFQTLDDAGALEDFLGKIFKATGQKPRIDKFGDEGKLAMWFD